MWKNKISRKGINFLYSTYEVNGLNLDKFINTVKKRGVDIVSVKKKGNKQLLISIKFSDCEKFFAIAKELCYNIKKVGDGGKAYPLLKLFNNIGIAIGTLIIFIISSISSDYIFSIEFIGSGSICKREIKEYLSKSGVSEFSRFSEIDLSVLEDKILSSNDRLSFVGVKKRGNRLIINSVLSTEKVKTLNTNIEALYSDAVGVVDNFKVYRGTALIEKGQMVNVGDLLVDGYATIKEQKVKINVLASVTLICSKDYVYRWNKAGEENTAVLLAEAEFTDKEIVSCPVSVKKEGDFFIYTVSVRYKHLILAG